MPYRTELLDGDDVILSCPDTELAVGKAVLSRGGCDSEVVGRRRQY